MAVACLLSMRTFPFAKNCIHEKISPAKDSLGPTFYPCTLSLLSQAPMIEHLKALLDGLLRGSPLIESIRTVGVVNGSGRVKRIELRWNLWIKA